MPTTRLERRQFVEFRAQDGARLPHLPGLDGLRGLAVLAVVLFHADLGVMVGGFLGVSTFFTLSGFLIGSLLLLETADGDSVDLRAFWGRRFRRLLPASLILLLLVATLFAWFVATPEQVDGLRGGVLSSLAQVANWHFILSGSSYGDLFAAPSPLLHFWSLAIEEQFYLLFPLAMLGLWRAAKGRHVVIGAVLAVLALASALEPLLFTMSRDRIYFGTDTRAAELLLGALLAVVFTNDGLRKRLVARGPVRTGALVLGAAALGLQIYWWWGLEQSTGFLYKGGFALYALLTCAVLLAATVPAGPLRGALSTPPLVYLGLRSYGIYLFHWPIFLAVRQTWPTLSVGLRAIIGITASLLVAELSFRLIERPIRERRWPSANRFPRFAALGIVTVAVIAFTIPTDTADPEGQLDFDQAAADMDALLQEQQALQDERDRAAGTAPTTTAAPEVVPTPSIATFGDSTALLLAFGMLQYGVDTGRLVGLPGDATLGCGVSRFDRIRVDSELDYGDNCTTWPGRWAAAVQQQQPDIAQIVTGAWEVVDGQLPGSNQFATIGDPAVDAFITSELLAAVDVLGAQGAMVLLVLWPRDSTAVAQGASQGISAKADPARWDRLHQIMRDVAAQRPETARVLELQEYLGPRVEDTTLRPDGIHIPAEQSYALYQEWMADETLRIWEDFWRDHRAATETAPPATPGG
jgi:peptidoglycan/LPS O-acetylase OafA/YrhL